MKVDWQGLWMAIFGTDEWLGLNMGFWVAMGIIAIVVLVQNIVFWRAFSPYDKYRLRHKNEDDDTQ